MRKGIKMSLAERNRYIQILHRNETSRKMIATIMKDIDKSGIFQDEDVVDDYDYDNDNDNGFDSAADIVFDENSTQEEKNDAVASLKKERPVKRTGKKGKLLITEEMILVKQREYISAGIVPEGDVDPNRDYDERELEPERQLDSEPDFDSALEVHARYGRSPLHEAIAYKNMKYVKKCIKEKKYLDSIDNNGNTPREMAFYEGWMDVVKLFDLVC